MSALPASDGRSRGVEGRLDLGLALVLGAAALALACTLYYLGVAEAGAMSTWLAVLLAAAGVAGAAGAFASRRTPRPLRPVGEPVSTPRGEAVAPGSPASAAAGAGAHALARRGGELDGLLLAHAQHHRAAGARDRPLRPPARQRLQGDRDQQRTAQGVLVQGRGDRALQPALLLDPARGGGVALSPVQSPGGGRCCSTSTASRRSTTSWVMPRATRHSGAWPRSCSSTPAASTSSAAMAGTSSPSCSWRRPRAARACTPTASATCCRAFTSPTGGGSPRASASRHCRKM